MTDPPPPDQSPAEPPQPESPGSSTPEQPGPPGPGQSPFSRPAMDVVEKGAGDHGVERR
jgi:hypothetical protein